jgi:thiamine transport system permease protein
MTSRIGRIVWFTVWETIASTAAVLLLAIPLASVLSRSTSRFARFAIVFSSVPFTLPTVVVGAAFLATLPIGLRQGWFAILCAHIFFNLGMAVRSLTDALRQTDAGLWEAARTLGASPFTAWRTVTFAQTRATLTGVATMVASLCATSFGVVLLLGGPRFATVDVEIYRQAISLNRIDRAAALAVLQFVGIGLILWRLARQPPAINATRSQRQRASAPRRVTSLAAAALLGVVATPLVSLAVKAFTTADGSIGLANFTRLAAITSGSGLAAAPLDALVPSVLTALVAAALAFTVAGLLSVAATMSHSVTVRRITDLLTSLPLAISSVALGLGVLVGFSSEPFAWRRSSFLLPCVQAVICLPFVARTLIPALSRVPQAQREVAQTLGASPWQAWITVTARQVRRSAALAFALAFTVALGEFGATSFLARPQAPTLPVAIARLASRPGAILQGQSAALAMILGALTTGCVAVIEFSRRKP